MSSTDESNEEMERIPSIFINSDLLQFKPSRCVDFCNSVFEEKFSNIHEDKILTNIEVFAKKISSESDDDASLENDSEHSDIIDTVTKTLHGYVINGNIFVTNNQWNTLVTVDEESLCCAVCDTTLELDDVELHVNSIEHYDNVENHKLLDIYNFTRKIGNFYHCGVCNLLVDIPNLEDHNETEVHVCNKIHAQNKACDIVDKDESLAENHDIISDMESTDSDIFYSGSDNEVEHSDQCGDDPSYATVASKPKVEFIEKTYENKVVKVSYDSWNMIMPMKINEFYCMACKKIMLMSQKVKHCDDVTHIEKINNCRIVRMFENHFIRQIDEKFFHCGHCNQLQNALEMETHVDLIHPKRKVSNDGKGTKTPTKIIDTTNNGAETTINSDKKDETKNDTDIMMNGKKDASNNDKIDASKNDTISKLTMSIAPFGATVLVSLLAYNVTCRRVNNDYYCALCDEIFGDEDKIKLHFYDSAHLEAVSRCPFIPNFKHNLIRAIRNAYHCTLCNIPVHIYNIRTHIESPEHVEILNKLSPAVYNPPNPFMGGFPRLVPMSPIAPIPISPYGPFAYYQQLPLRPIVNIPLIPQNNRVPIIVTDAPRNDHNSHVDKKSSDVINNETEDATTEKCDKTSDDDDFDVEDYMYVKYKNFLYKITLLSYHTMNETGRKFCAVCATKVMNHELKRHIRGAKHTENLKKLKFIEEYKDHLLRQNHLIYHCAICNLVFPKSYVKMHLQWPMHCLRYEETKNSKISKKTELENRVASASLGGDKEKEYPNEREPKIKVCFRMEFETVDENKNDKLIIHKNQVFRVKFSNWHSLVETKDNYKCFLCQADFDAGELSQHLNFEHMDKLQQFVEEYQESFLRKINDKLVHCIICNSELPIQENIVAEHIKGKKHKKNYEETPKEPMTYDTIANFANDVVLIID